MTHQPEFEHIHLSGLWDAPKVRWAAAITMAHRLASVVSVTEFTLAPVKAPKGWAVYHPSGEGRKECAIFWDTEVWDDPQGKFAEPISHTDYALGSGKTRPPVHLIGLSLRHRATGKRVTFEVLHTPSAIEGHGGLVAGVRRAKAMNEAMTGILKRRKAHKHEDTVLSGDWNLNLKLPWVQAYFRARLRGFRNGWRIMPKSGTHGKRLIDGVRITRRLRIIGSSMVLSPVAGFDHRMVLTTIGWRASKR